MISRVEVSPKVIKKVLSSLNLENREIKKISIVIESDHFVTIEVEENMGLDQFEDFSSILEETAGMYDFEE